MLSDIAIDPEVDLGVAHEALCPAARLNVSLPGMAGNGLFRVS